MLNGLDAPEAASEGARGEAAAEAVSPVGGENGDVDGEVTLVNGLADESIAGVPPPVAGAKGLVDIASDGDATKGELPPGVVAVGGGGTLSVGMAKGLFEAVVVKELAVGAAGAGVAA